jgi:DNA-binding transcriptional MocR family regulator
VETISFGGEAISPDLIPVEELADCAETALRQDGGRILSYGTGAGYTPLRELIAEKFEVNPFRVLLTNGWLQGFNLLTRGRISARNVIAEYPTYAPALRAIFQGEANLLYIDHRPEGFDFEQISFQIRTSQKPALAYLVPTFHNPTGTTMPEQQRLDFGAVLYKADVLIVEDDSYGALRFEGEEVPTVFELSAKTAVYSASLGTPLAPGLRVGAFILPDELARELTALANDTYITPALLAQATIFELMHRGAYEPHLEQLRERLLERRDTMIAALEQHFEGATWTKPEGGFYLLLTLPPGTNAKELVELAEGAEAAPGADFMGLPHTLRLNFAGPALEEIESGIERLAVAWRQMPPPVTMF